MADKAPERECDVIMKGGITSGVVFPGAVKRLARDYAFRSIGGTSAGAIAAAVTAAAETNRPDGFAAMDRLADDLQTRLPTLFQPAPEARPLFALLKHGVLERRYGRAFRSLLLHHGQFAIVGAMAALVLGLFSAAIGGGPFGVVFALIVFAAATVVLSAWSVASNAAEVLRDNDYGLCPGPTQPDADGVGLSDWLAEAIEEAAGRAPPEDPEALRAPLTFGDLTRAARPVALAMTTTNLSLRRPNRLPDLAAQELYFEEGAFRRVLPGWVVDWMIGRDGAEPGPAPGVWRLPGPDDLPVVVATRMSLSFPLMISAVPLHAMDRADGVLRRMLFSDGGLSSNFPIHFFDALLPSRPTFGIALEPASVVKKAGRVRLPIEERPDPFMSFAEPAGPLGFVRLVLDTMQEWQDRLQTSLPGYRERVVEIYLEVGEGGYNVDMAPELIAALSERGGEAAELLAGEGPGRFDFDDHRWRRFLVAYARLEGTLAQAATRWSGAGGAESFAAFVKRVSKDPESFAGTPPDVSARMIARFDGLMTHVAGWDEPLAPKADIPEPPSDLRITPRA